MIEDVAREFPTLMEPLIFERDRFLAFQLHEACAAGIPAHRARSPVGPEYRFVSLSTFF